MNKLFLILLLVVLSMCAYAENYTFTGDNYVVKTGEKGDIVSLVVNDEEYLGKSYFYTNDAPFEKTVTKEGNKLIIKSSVGVATYEFLPDRIQLVADNIKAINYFIELNICVKGIKNNKFIKAPCSYEEKSHVIVRNNSAIDCIGDMKLWGSWNNALALDVWFQEKPMTIKETLIPRKLTQEEYNLINEDNNPIKIYSPVNYQVFQRQTKKSGFITFSGIIDLPIDNLQYKITGKDLNDKPVNIGWKSLKLFKGIFKEDIKVPAGGWYQVQLKYKEKGEEKILNIDKVGVGEIIVGAGQSNSTNCGQFPSKQETGMVASTDGVNWKYADDPMLGVHDYTEGGSLYPALGDALYREFHVPIGVAATGHGGTNIEVWQPSSNTYGYYENLFLWFMNRVNKLGKYGFRCVIWHQGESNVGTPSEIMYYGLKNTIESSRQDAGWEIPWFVAKVSYCTPTNRSDENIRNAHQMIWDTGIAYEGPDTDVLTEEYRDYDGQGIHLNLKGLKKHGEMWAEKLIPYIYSQID